MHSRTIIHIDIDYYYAQVEELENPDLKDKPVGIQQKNCVVTCNYKARTFGIKKLMNVPDSLKLCPELVLVNGEDISKYKKMSDRIHAVLLKFVPNVEKLGLDENYLDVTELVSKQLKEESLEVEMEEGTFVVEYAEGMSEKCTCGCSRRLNIGTKIAKKIRNALFTELGITSCAGISYNKLLAKLVGSLNKPNKQTVIFPEAVAEFMSSLDSVRSLVGVGHKMAENLEVLGITTIKELQQTSMAVLKKKFDEKMCERLKNLAVGIDKSEVKPTGKQKTISIEDSTFQNPLKTVLEVETKFNVLLTRLVDAVKEDGRLPSALRITVRKSDHIKDILLRESKQKEISSSWFRSQKTTEIVNLLLPVAMSLFRQIIDPSLNLTISLLGVAVTKFIEEPPKTNNSLMKFFVKKSEISESPKKLTEKSPVPDVEELKTTSSSEMLLQKSPESVDESPLKRCLDPPNPSPWPPPKRLKLDEQKQPGPTSAKPPAIAYNFEIPKDMDVKAFNKLPVREKHRIMSELKSVLGAGENSSKVEYPRKEEFKNKSKLDAFLFKY